MESAVSWGLLILRVWIGLALFGHGAQKLFGWFGGHGVEGTGGFLGSLGYRPRRMMAAVAGLVEAGGGLLLALGFLTPLAIAALIGHFANIIVAVHLKNGFWNQNQGYEYPAFILVAAIALGLAGPGAYSIDRAAGWHLAGWAWLVGELVVGLVVGAGVLLSRRVQPAPSVPEVERRRPQAA